MSIPENRRWFAVRTKPNFERIATDALLSRDIETFLPAVRIPRRWSDRTKLVDEPLFPGYTLSRFVPEFRLPVLSAPGVHAIVGFGSTAAPIADDEVESLKLLIASGQTACRCPYLNIGQKVKIESGALKGVQGIVVRTKSTWRVVVSVELLQRSVYVEVDQQQTTLATA